MMRLALSILLSGLALLLLPPPARGALSFALTPSAQPATGTNEVFFVGTLSNTSPTENLFLNNIQFTFTNTATNYLIGDTNSFFANVPGILSPGQAYHDVVLGVYVSTNTPPGNYAGTATIIGGTNIFSTTNLPAQALQVSFPTTLAVARSGNNFVFSWPVPPAGFALQRNADLATTNWTAVTNAAIVTNGQYRVVLSSTNPPQFYRLAFP